MTLVPIHHVGNPSEKEIICFNCVRLRLGLLQLIFVEDFTLQSRGPQNTTTTCYHLMTISTDYHKTATARAMASSATVHKRFVLQPRWAFHNRGASQTQRGDDPPVPTQTQPSACGDHVLNPPQNLSDSTGNTKCSSSELNYYYITPISTPGSVSWQLPMRSRNIDFPAAQALGFTENKIIPPPEGPNAITSLKPDLPFFPLSLDENDPCTLQEEASSFEILRAPPPNGITNFCSTPPLVLMPTSAKTRDGCLVVRPVPKHFRPTDA